jgi:hypothetical protein
MRLPEPGSRSRQVELFMVLEDEDAFGACVAERLNGQAVWMATPRPSREPSYHDSLRAALDASDPPGLQAFIRVVGVGGAPVGPVVQYQASRHDVQDGARVLRNGRLAYKWFPDRETQAVVNQFDNLAQVAWQCMIASTHPHVGLMDGTPIRGARIGSHAKAWVLADPSRMLADRGARYHVYRLLR